MSRLWSFPENSAKPKFVTCESQWQQKASPYVHATCGLPRVYPTRVHVQDKTLVKGWMCEVLLPQKSVNIVKFAMHFKSISCEFKANFIWEEKNSCFYLLKFWIYEKRFLAKMLLPKRIAYFSKTLWVGPMLVGTQGRRSTLSVHNFMFGC